jgi:hypothetical protein
VVEAVGQRVTDTSALLIGAGITAGATIFGVILAGVVSTVQASRARKHDDHVRAREDAAAVLYVSDMLVLAARAMCEADKLPDSFEAKAKVIASLQEPIRDAYRALGRLDVGTEQWRREIRPVFIELSRGIEELNDAIEAKYQGLDSVRVDLEPIIDEIGARRDSLAVLLQDHQPRRWWQRVR